MAPADEIETAYRGHDQIEQQAQVGNARRAETENHHQRGVGRTAAEADRGVGDRDCKKYRCDYPYRYYNLAHLENMLQLPRRNCEVVDPIEQIKMTASSDRYDVYPFFVLFLVRIQLDQANI